MIERMHRGPDYSRILKPFAPHLICDRCGGENDMPDHVVCSGCLGDPPCKTGYNKPKPIRGVALPKSKRGRPRKSRVVYADVP